MIALLALLAASPAFAGPTLAAPAAKPLQVGSKQFTESVILGELARQTLESAGLPAAHRRELGGTRVLWEALRAGQIDVYPEYTGTLLQEILPGANDLAAALAAQGVKSTAPLGFEDSYAVGVRRAVAERLGLRTLSDLARHPEVSLALSNEFLQRKDGWPRLREVYGFRAEPRGLQHDLAYRAMAAGQLDATDLYSTDAEIRAHDLVVLRDDRRAFPAYAAVLLYRQGLAPEAAAALEKLSGRIDEAAMIALNARARLDHVPEEQVAQEFLGLRATAQDTRAQRLWRRTREHLFLVGVSLLAAILTAVPLGILAARHRRLGQALLAVTGLLQTIPSLALLVLLIPLLGIGTGPALVALYLYGLLPIVRNTYTGLTAIPPDLRETAEALGLPRGARLRLIELPMASRTILAGIQTSAVINVGTATLGALIGAGGYGQPILTGIRLADTGILLEGALPAAAMALLVQAGFDLLERALPRV